VAFTRSSGVARKAAACVVGLCQQIAKCVELVGDDAEASPASALFAFEQTGFDQELSPAPPVSVDVLIQNG
jgi:hypothetical protein